MIRATGIVRLVRDPELRDAGGTQVCNMRVAYDTRRKDASGEWGNVGNFIDVAAFGRQAENCAQYLSKGSQAFVDGRLEIREWETDAGEKRSAAQIVADNVRFIGGNNGSAGGASDDFPAAPDDDLPF